MTKIYYREIQPEDIQALAKIRSKEWGSEAYWISRIQGYLNGSKSPKQAKPERMIFVAAEEEKIIGFIAGHLTNRFECQGELQWINVIESYQGKGIASKLLQIMAKWFVQHRANSVCVNVEPDNAKGLSFYTKHKAETLDDHWMKWENISVLDQMPD